ncbi:class II aldolase/adducin family protein [Acidihalobacter ferrooxydans]|uniref:Class II aldolase n=1 Tax=Acidihalobacter ferrooxydans TaxID=1765967 RepID=A0A1P8UHG7_9GAMM|nr:class II aldolase/adducin family protein [Acidihalobacter ferrooxydans]APZ43279.1 class II aldolase [Acidihalobacter ferrooxydans]
MTPAAQLLAGMQRMAHTGLNQGTSGNLSVRTPEGFLVTPSGVPVERLRAEDMVPMRLDGTAHGHTRPSSEWRMHRDLYAAFPAAQAVAHAHPPHATALACRREGIPAFHYMVAVAGGHDIRCADYATFGTAALSTNAIAALRGRTACLLANHGILAYGADLERAIALALEVEALARQYLLARQQGEPVLLDAAEMDNILVRFKSYGVQPDQEETP